MNVILSKWATTWIQISHVDWWCSASL
jgi:hypothetical protein